MLVGAINYDLAKIKIVELRNKDESRDLDLSRFKVWFGSRGLNLENLILTFLKCRENCEVL